MEKFDKESSKERHSRKPYIGNCILGHMQLCENTNHITLDFEPPFRFDQ